MEDLHDLLQHYEECHVRLEDDEASLFDEEDANSWSPSLSFSSLSSVDESSSMPNSPTMDDHESNIDTLKKRAAAYLSDLYNATSSSSSSSSSASSVSSCSSYSTPPSPTCSSNEDDLSIEENVSKRSGKKRSYNQYASGTPSALELLTQSAAKKLALASGDLPTPMLSDEDFLAQAGALLASANTSMFIWFINYFLF